MDNKRITLTFKIGSEKCNTVILPEFTQDRTYSDDFQTFYSGDIKHKNRLLDVMVWMRLPKQVARDLNLAREE